MANSRRFGIVAVLLPFLAPLAHAEEGWHLGPGFQLARPGFELHLAGYAQEDFRSYRNFANDRGELPDLDEQAELRRARLGVDMTWKRLDFEVQFDLADDVERVKNAYGELKIAKALHVRVGNFKVPVSGEWLTSAAKTDFIERSLLASLLAPGRDLGVSLSGGSRKWLTYEVGVFKGDGRKDQTRADTTAAGRFVVTPIKSLDVAASYSQGEVKAQSEVEGADVRAKGFPGHSPSGFGFYVRHFVNGTRRRFGADARYTPGPVGLGVEVLQGREQRKGQGSVFDDLPDEIATGWAASATWLLTGEAKKRTIVPSHPLHRGGPGAIELGVRYEALRYDDAGADTGFAGAGNRARNIRPVEDTVLTGGLSWWPVAWVRLMGNVVVEKFDDPLLTPVAGKTGNYVTLLGRVQVALP